MFSTVIFFLLTKTSKQEAIRDTRNMQFVAQNLLAMIMILNIFLFGIKLVKIRQKGTKRDFKQRMGIKANI